MILVLLVVLVLVAFRVTLSIVNDDHYALREDGRVWIKKPGKDWELLEAYIERDTE